MRLRVHWGSGALVLVLVTAGILFLTGRLQFQWRPVATTGSAEHKDDDGHDHGKEGHKDDEGRVVGDKALLDADAIKAAGIRTAPAEKGSVAVALQVTAEVELPDQRLANVTARLPGVVREVYRARGDRVVVGTPLCAIESAELGEARAVYVAALADARVAEANHQAWQKHGRPGGEPSAAGGWVELDQALAEHAAALAERALAERNLARVRELQERGLRSRTELLAAEADVSRAVVKTEAAARRLAVLGSVAETEKNRARARVEAATTKLKALGVEPREIGERSATGRAEITSRFVVKSPIAGIVAEQLVTVGQTVDAASKIFTVMDLSQVWVTGALHDRDAATVRPGVPAVVHIEGLLNGGVKPGGVSQGFKGRVVQIGPQVDEKTRTLPVRVAIQNVVLPGGGDAYALRPGMFAMVDLETARKHDVLVVPAAAVQTIGGKPVVFVETALTDGAAFQRRDVVLGARDAEVTEVTEGLRPGERVVVANAYLLKSEFERAKISHGHAH